jgi:Ca2+-transporting ATPase
MVAWSLLQGLLAFAVVATVYVVALRWGMPVPEVRALTFFSLIVVIVSLILVNRSFSASLLTALRRPNLTLVAVLAAVAIILALTMLWPFANQLFAFGPLHVDDLALTLGAGVIALLVLELLKPLLRPRLQSVTRPSDPLAMDQTPKPTGR